MVFFARVGVLKGTVGTRWISHDTAAQKTGKYCQSVLATKAKTPSVVKMTEKERALIAGCLRSEKAAWDSFILQYSNLVYHTIRKTLSLHRVESDTDLVEDLYQEFFVSLLRNNYQKLRRFSGAHGCSLASWLRILAARSTIDFLRKPSPSQGDLTSAISRYGPDPAEPLINEQQERLLKEAIQTLSSRDRILLDLCYRQALATEEVAAFLKTSVNAIYAQKSRVLTKIRETLKKSGAL